MVGSLVGYAGGKAGCFCRQIFVLIFIFWPLDGGSTGGLWWWESWGNCWQGVLYLFAVVFLVYLYFHLLTSDHSRWWVMLVGKLGVFVEKYWILHFSSSSYSGSDQWWVMVVGKLGRRPVIVWRQWSPSQSRASCPTVNTGCRDTGIGTRGHGTRKEGSVLVSFQLPVNAFSVPTQDQLFCSMRTSTCHGWVSFNGDHPQLRNLSMSTSLCRKVDQFRSAP